MPRANGSPAFCIQSLEEKTGRGEIADTSLTGVDAKGDGGVGGAQDRGPLVTVIRAPGCC